MSRKVSRLVPVILLAVVIGAKTVDISAQGCSANGNTGFGQDDTCPVPSLIFSVSGTCINACGNTVSSFQGASRTATGACTSAVLCRPLFRDRNVFDPVTGEFYTDALGRAVGTPAGDPCKNSGQLVKSGAFCTCGPCGGTGLPGTQNPTAPGEDPLVISVSSVGYQFTSYENGVKFDLDLDGEAERTAWTAAESDDAFLVLDRNFNGIIDDGSEIFGDQTPQLPSDEPNGFRALAVFDDRLNGGNEDGRIDAADQIYGSLLLWTDVNHDGKSSGRELRPLEGHVTAIHLDYQRSYSRDEFGHYFKYWAALERPAESTGATVAWNIFFVRPTGRN